jgi:ethanolamine-phosphate cytidylyltransferase
MEKYNCDFCVHGDDITTLSDGTDCYQAVKDAGKYRECKRTQGVSTTELVGRMLLMTRDHHNRSSINDEDLTTFSSNVKRSPEIRISNCLPTSKKIIQFSEGREPEPGDRVVYVDGTFDLFHVGHIEFLRRARTLGDYLLVGIHDDQVSILK